MNKKAVAAGVILGVSLIVVLILMILNSTWTGDVIQPVPYGTEPGKGLSWALFENYGTLMFVLAMLLFGAIIGGAAIARGEKNEEDEE